MGARPGAPAGRRLNRRGVGGGVNGRGGGGGANERGVHGRGVHGGAHAEGCAGEGRGAGRACAAGAGCCGRARLAVLRNCFRTCNKSNKRRIKELLRQREVDRVEKLRPHLRRGCGSPAPRGTRMRLMETTGCGHSARCLAVAECAFAAVGLVSCVSLCYPWWLSELLPHQVVLV